MAANVSLRLKMAIFLISCIMYSDSASSNGFSIIEFDVGQDTDLVRIELENGDEHSSYMKRSTKNSAQWIVKHEFADFFVEPRFVIRWRNGEKTSKIINYEIFSTRIGIRIRKGKKLVETIPIKLLKNISSTNIDRIDRMKYTSDLYDKYFLAYQLWEHLNSRLGPADSYTRNAARIWFDAAFELSTSKRSVFVMQPEPYIAMLNANPENKKRYNVVTRQYLEAKSIIFEHFWFRIRKLARVGKCDWAAQLFQQLRNRGERQPDAMRYRSLNKTHFVEMNRTVSRACPENARIGDL